ncbi:MAG: ROK family protein [Anaerolineae bacterium]|nr:ROK family protein [Candidatus Roseilinea sp.]MDW8451499.1 ROK family protein [Anaerolineae bacterium]
MDQRFSIGIDVGGTKIAAGIVTFPSGELLEKRVRPTHPERGGPAVLDDVLALARELGRAAQQPIACIGLGVCELVDLCGNVTSGFTVAWQGLPVQAALSEIAPAVVESDVRAHARGEARFGAGRNYRDFVFVTLGTGISACLVHDGVPYPGARGNALVLATAPLTLVDETGRRTQQVLEEFASGPAIARRFGVDRAEAVFEAAQAGDPRAVTILHTAGQAIGNSIAFLCNVLDPEAVVIGGGLGGAGGVFWDALVAATREHIWSDETRALPIVRAMLGNDAGVIGAAATAHERFTETQA